MSSEAAILKRNANLMMGDTRQLIEKFVSYASRLSGDEKGEAQVFCDRLFQAFGHEGYKEAGATLESRQKRQGKGTGFIDLLWKPRLLLEMKKRGEKLQRHYTQAFEYWLGAVPQRPRYVVLCNFDEFWIYDFDLQLNDPVDRIPLVSLPDRYTALNFLFPVERKPQFGDNRVDVTRAAADKVATVFNSLTKRGEDRNRAQRFMLQCVVAMFSEDTDLLPRGLFSELLNDCLSGRSTYDLVGGLFRQMNEPNPARGGRYESVRYFNGGIFSLIEPVELKSHEIGLLLKASEENWSKVQPPIFGTLFENSMDKEERHAFGAHFTSEADIQKVVLPTIVRPWRERIEAACTATELKKLLEELRQFRVLDPACGSGNFLYVAYREVVRLELELMARVHTEFKEKERERVGMRTRISTKQFFGIEKNPFGVELAKVTLMLAKEMALDEAKHYISEGQSELPFEVDSPLPLDNLDNNIFCGDALFTPWPTAQAIIGNPPYLGSRYLAQEHGYEYANRIYAEFPKVPKMADYCVHWFWKAHDHLPVNGRAGLVGTNTIRQNESREASLDYVIQNGGTITEAVSTQVWSGDANVHVSIVNWIKGALNGPKNLFTQVGDRVDSPIRLEVVDRINSSLSTEVDLSLALSLRANETPKRCYVGQYPFNEGFLVSPEEAITLIRKDPKNREVIFPYLIGRDLLERGQPSRWIIDFAKRDLTEAMTYDLPFTRVKLEVMEDVLAKAEDEKAKTGKATTRWTRMSERWWQFRDYQPGTMKAIASIPRYVACSRVTKRPIFEFVDSRIHPDNALVVFPFADDYSFGVLQSTLHGAWFKGRCSTLKGDFRYTSETVFDSFPWPQACSEKQAVKISKAACALRELRHSLALSNKWNLRQMYKSLEMPGTHKLKDAHAALDEAVRDAYGIGKRDHALEFLLELNRELSAKEANGEAIVGPGLPAVITDLTSFVTEDCITSEGLQ